MGPRGPGGHRARSRAGLEAEVLDSIRLDRPLAADAEDAFDRGQTPRERFAHRVVALVGSWPFAVGILTFLALWLAVNVLGRPFEPYPMIVLAGMGAVLASLAGLQGPIILMSQRYSRHRDRLRSKHEYQINLKAELEIQYLTEQVEHVLRRQREILEALDRVSSPDDTPPADHDRPHR